jgi:hypothetical protein
MLELRQRAQRHANSRIEDIVEEQDAQSIRDVNYVRATLVQFGTVLNTA